MTPPAGNTRGSTTFWTGAGSPGACPTPARPRSWGGRVWDVLRGSMAQDQATVLFLLKGAALNSDVVKRISEYLDPIGAVFCGRALGDIARRAHVDELYGFARELLPMVCDMHGECVRPTSDLEPITLSLYPRSRAKGTGELALKAELKFEPVSVPLWLHNWFKCQLVARHQTDSDEKVLNKMASSHQFYEDVFYANSEAAARSVASRIREFFSLSGFVIGDLVLVGDEEQGDEMGFSFTFKFPSGRWRCGGDGALCEGGMTHSRCGNIGARRCYAVFKNMNNSGMVCVERFFNDVEARTEI